MTAPAAPQLGPLRKWHFAQQTVEADVLALARERMAHAYDLFDHVAVSFSGGKDSTVCLELALAEAETRGRLPLDAIFCDEEAIPYETEAYVRRRAGDPRLALRWYCLPVRHRNACTPQDPIWWPWAPEARDLWVRPLPLEGLSTLVGFPHDDPPSRYSWPDVSGLLFEPHRHGRVGLIMGLRAEESYNRRNNVLARQIDNYMAPYVGATSRGNVTLVKPIYDWTTSDVWTAPQALGWDYNDAYRLMDMAGVPAAQQRCSPPFGEEPLQRLWTYHVCFPDVWERMAGRVPGAATAARYARSRLYSGKESCARPENQTWPAHIAAVIERFDADSRPRVAAKVQAMVRRHYRKTSDPILGDVPHPLTGLSWAFLARVASRGDFKNRQQESKNLGKAPRAVLLARYKEAMEREQGGIHDDEHGPPAASD